MSSISFVSFSYSDTAVSSISISGEHACALFGSPFGRIICWGYGDSGQLGTGSTSAVGFYASDMTSLPFISFSTTDAALSISAGQAHTCALFSITPGEKAGKIRCWGNNVHGQLGNGGTGNVGVSPNHVSNIKYIGFSDTLLSLQVTAGSTHTCAVFTNERIRCWGYGSQGALGYGSTQSIGGTGSTSMLSLPYISLMGSVLVNVIPAAAPVAGGTYITISGANFFTTVSVTFANANLNLSCVAS
jgi:hypothetical protein